MKPATDFEIVHLYNRLAFGITPAEMQAAQGKSCSQIINEIYSAADKFADIDEVDTAQLSTMDVLSMNKEERKALFEKGLLFTKKLNLTLLDKFINDKAQARLKMTLFWSGHFACRSLNAAFQQKLFNTIQENSLGNFKTLLLEVSKSSAMLQFLNNQQNRKRHPNENFAREVMELFTLGRGHYTEQDIKESARAFTGWYFNAHGEYEFRALMHDNGIKIFLGEQGNFSGEDIINIILQQPQCSIFITRKFYKYFVNEENIDEQFVSDAADVFRKSNYEIAALAAYIFTHPHFYEQKNIGTRIKPPVELITSLLRNVKVEFDNKALLINAQKILGQILFLPPSVAGWAGGRNWIDSSSLLYRMSLPRLFFKNEVPMLQAKQEADDQLMDKNETDLKRHPSAKEMMQTYADTESFVQHFEKIDDKNLVSFLKNMYLGMAQNTLPSNTFNEFENLERKEKIKKTSLYIFSMPQFQLG